MNSEDRYFVNINQESEEYGWFYRYYGENEEEYELHAELVSPYTSKHKKDSVIEISEEDYEKFLELELNKLEKGDFITHTINKYLCVA